MKKLCFIYDKNASIDNPSSGTQTYNRDFMKIVYPHIVSNFTLVEENADIVFSFTKSYEIPDVEKNPNARFIKVLHTLNKRVVENQRKIVPNLLAISHYKPLVPAIQQNFEADSIYIPMSIDTEILPDPVEKNNKLLYFGNLFGPLKKQTFQEKLLNNAINFDKISAQMFNDETVLSHSNVMNLVNQYSYGLGVGRCVLEMLSMGLLVLIMGRHYGGPISNQEEFEEHWEVNCNSVVSTGTNIVADYQKLKNTSNYQFDKNQIDMRNFINNYLEALDL